MTMNEITLNSGELLSFVVAIVVSFTLGGIYKLRRNVLRQRRAVELGERDLKDLVDRYDRQQVSMTRLDQEVTDMRQAMLQQALALMPVRTTVQVPVAPAAVAEAPAAVVPQVQATVAAPVTAAPRPRTCESKPAGVAVARRAAAAKPPVRPAAFAKPQRPSKPGPMPAPFNPVQLARKGAKADVLMSRCGLSRAEADLVLSVHGATAAQKH